jgi:hypothetical protein
MKASLKMLKSILHSKESMFIVFYMIYNIENCIFSLVVSKNKKYFNKKIEMNVSHGFVNFSIDHQNKTDIPV